MKSSLELIELDDVFGDENTVQCWALNRQFKRTADIKTDVFLA